MKIGLQSVVTRGETNALSFRGLTFDKHFLLSFYKTAQHKPTPGKSVLSVCDCGHCYKNGRFFIHIY